MEWPWHIRAIAYMLSRVKMKNYREVESFTYLRSPGSKYDAKASDTMRKHQLRCQSIKTMPVTGVFCSP